MKARTYTQFVLVAALLASPSAAETETKQHRDGCPLQCPVHGERLRTEFISISYGLINRDYERESFETRLFPHAKSRIMGGCVVGKRHMKIHYCAECREAESAWLKARERRRGLLRKADRAFLRDNPSAKITERIDYHDAQSEILRKTIQNEEAHRMISNCADKEGIVRIASRLLMPGISVEENGLKLRVVESKHQNRKDCLIVGGLRGHEWIEINFIMASNRKKRLEVHAYRDVDRTWVIAYIGIAD